MKVPNDLDPGDAARARSAVIARRIADHTLTLPTRWRAQSTHLTCPATQWKYIEGAVTKSRAHLVMLDLEDSIPRGDDGLLATGRTHIVRALRELDWGTKLRFFRPRGTDLDPSHEDLRTIVPETAGRLEGVILPKVEDPDEVASVDATLTTLEQRHGITIGSIRLGVLIESVRAEERAFEIARASRRLTSLIFGAFDYWSSLGITGIPYRFDHPLIDQVRGRIARAAASVGVAAIAEMTTNYPTRDKSAAEQAEALEECRRDALRARAFGFRGKWVGIPAQVDIVNETFALAPTDIERSVRAVRAFLDAEQRGLGAIMFEGRMADRATDRVHRTLLAEAFALGQLDEATARALAIE